MKFALAALVLAVPAFAASVPFSFDCNKQAGFVMDPNQHQTVGYLTQLAFGGLKTPLPADLTVNTPAKGKVKVVGVLEKFSWDGAQGGALTLDFYVSQENAVQIKSLSQTTLKTTTAGADLWIQAFDQEKKSWFDALADTGLVHGLISGKENPELNVDLTPVPVKDGVSVNVYKVHLALVPAANQQYALKLSNASGKPVVKPWGLVIGTLAKPAVSH